METSGVVLQERDILNSPIMTFSNAFAVYMYLKLKANWKESSFYFGYQKITLQEGQVFVMQSHIAKELKLPKGSIKKVLLLLQNEGLICINKTTNKYTVITINNYHVDFEKYKQNANKTKTKLKQNLSVSKNSNITQINSNITPTENFDSQNLKEIESSNPPYTPPLTEMLDETIKHFNDRLGKRYKSTKSLLGNFEKWTEVYSLDEIKSAIDVLPRHHFWKDKMTPTILFRTMGRDKNPVDYIGDLLNYSPTLTTVEPKNNLKNWI